MSLTDVASLLRGSDEVSQEETIECRRCGASCPKDAVTCSNCGEKPTVPTLVEWGRQLPIGILDAKNKTLGREFSVKKIDFHVEREISLYWNKYRKTSSKVNVIDYIPIVLAHTVQTLDGQDITKLSIDRKLGAIRAMFMGDVMYMYAYERVETLGPDFLLKFVECPMCGGKFDYPVNLSSLEIATRDDYADLLKSVELRDGFSINNVTYKKVTMMPFTFQAVSGMDIENETDSLAFLLKASVCGIEGLPEGTPMTDSEVTQLSKFDMATLDSKMGYVSGGPDWTIDIKCKNSSCELEWVTAIDWRYSDFFAHSSRSTMRRRSKT